MTGEMTDTRIATTVAMLEQARRARDSLVQAQILAESQYQLAWALREAVADCQDDPRRSWAEIGRAIGLPRDTAWRQYQAGGPLVTVKAYQSADSPLSFSQPRAATDADALYAFRDEDDAWFGPYDELPIGHFSTGWLTFEPPNAPGSRFAGQELLVRYGPWDGDVSFHAAQIRDEASGNLVRVRITYEIIDWLFGIGQTALRQAITAVAQAVAITPQVNPQLVQFVSAATAVQGLDVPLPEFTAAIERVVESAPLGRTAGAQLNRALDWLQRALQQYRAWAARPQRVME